MMVGTNVKVCSVTSVQDFDGKIINCYAAEHEFTPLDDKERKDLNKSYDSIKAYSNTTPRRGRNR